MIIWGESSTKKLLAVNSVVLSVAWGYNSGVEQIVSGSEDGVVRIWTLGLVVIFSYLGLSKALGALRVSEGRRDKVYRAAHLLLASRVCAQLVGAPPRLRQACPHHNPS